MAPAPVRRFLTAEWRFLALLNYAVEPALLAPHAPRGTELDVHAGRVLLSLVGFRFIHTRLLGVAIPRHRHFDEVNLRCYVRRTAGGEVRRGVAFIREIVPLRAVAWVANTLFGERYISLPMRYVEAGDATALRTAYHWWYKSRWNSISLKAAGRSVALQEGSQEEFITEHFWGYAKAGANRTNEYQVAHPRWAIYPVVECLVDCDFGRLYGPAFANLGERRPQSAFLAEGSAIEVYKKKRL